MLNSAFLLALTTTLSFSLMGSLPAAAQVRGDRGSANIDAQIEQATSRLASRVLEQRDHYRLDSIAKQNLLNDIRSALTAFRTQPNPPPIDPRPPVGGLGLNVRAFSDDRCTNEVTSLRPADSCSMLQSIFGSQRIWSISLDGQCIDTSDTSFSQACPALSRLSANPPIRNPLVSLYTDDRCSNLLIHLDPSVNYAGLGSIMGGARVWSIKVENTCIDSPDQAYSDAMTAKLIDSAIQMRTRTPFGERVELFSDDRCSVPVTHVQPGDQCSLMDAFFSGQRVWSIMFRGRCVDVPDTSFSSACSQYTRPNGI